MVMGKNLIPQFSIMPHPQGIVSTTYGNSHVKLPARTNYCIKKASRVLQSTIILLSDFYFTIVLTPENSAVLPHD